MKSEQLTDSRYQEPWSYLGYQPLIIKALELAPGYDPDSTNIPSWAASKTNQQIR